jgi:hypothetical protein
MGKEYNGHPSKGHWNVALWIGNDEPTYRFAMDCVTGAKARNTARWVAIAAHRFLAVYGEEKTPDGFKYTTARVRAALRDLGE